MEDFTSGSKICILTVDPRAEAQCYLIHENKGKVDASGVWWSNDSCYLATYAHSYSDAWRQVSPKNMGLMDDEEFYAECLVCDTVILEEPTDASVVDFCPTCGCCWGCSIYKTDCLCYQGSNSKKPAHWWNADTQGAWGW